MKCKEVMRMRESESEWKRWPTHSKYLWQAREKFIHGGIRRTFVESSTLEVASSSRLVCISTRLRRSSAREKFHDVGKSFHEPFACGQLQVLIMHLNFQKALSHHQPKQWAIDFVICHFRTSLDFPDVCTCAYVSFHTWLRNGHWRWKVEWWDLEILHEMYVPCGWIGAGFYKACKGNVR